MASPRYVSVTSHRIQRAPAEAHALLGSSGRGLITHRVNSAMMPTLFGVPIERGLAALQLIR